MSIISTDGECFVSQPPGSCPSHPARTLSSKTLARLIGCAEELLCVRYESFSPLFLLLRVVVVVVVTAPDLPVCSHC